MKRYAAYYLCAGAAWWIVNQLYYVQGGKPYWQGIGAVSDPNQVFGGILNSVETIALWPLAAIRTTQMGSTAGD